MSDLSSVYTGTTAVLLLGIYAVWRVQRDFDADGRISVGTSILVLAAYLLHAFLTGYVAWRGLWTMSIPPTVARLVGASS